MNGEKFKKSAFEWKQYQSQRADAETIRDWFTQSQYGIGIVTGSVSGNLEMLELEKRAIDASLHKAAAVLALELGVVEIWNKFYTGYCEQSQNGGRHWLYRLDCEVPGNTKIAKDEAGLVTIETRGSGGYVIVAPSKDATGAKAWRALSGTPATVPTLTWDEREIIVGIFRTFDKSPVKEVIGERDVSKAINGQLRPGDDYNHRVAWSEILQGWKVIYTDKAGVTYWCRPGKDQGISATTKAQTGNLYVFSTSTPFDSEKPYNKFGAYTLLHHNGDFTAAARELARLGFGTPITGQSSVSNVAEPMTKNEPLNGDLGSNLSEELSKELSIPTRGELLLVNELEMGRARRAAKALLDAEDAIKRYDQVDYIESLTEELALPIIDTEWQIDTLFPRGANITIAAQYKAGKTTLINNLAKSLVDGTPFMDYFPACQPATVTGERVVIFNYEVSPNQYRRWLKEVNIINTDYITVVHLRGKSWPLISPHVRDEVVAKLKSLACTTWILDPFARAFSGSGDENSNSEVSVFLEWLDEIKAKAGVANLVMPVHTGRAEEDSTAPTRARGATRIDDWTDIRWMITRTKDGRFFSAEGRDVDLPQQLYTMNPLDRSLKLGGGDAKSVKKQNLEALWVEVVLNNPGKNTSELCSLISKSTNDRALISARKTAEARHLVKSVLSDGRSVKWFAPNYVPNTTQKMA
jgi:hypothetical protein